jgi:hypothetical protein
MLRLCEVSLSPYFVRCWLWIQGLAFSLPPVSAHGIYFRICFFFEELGTWQSQCADRRNIFCCIYVKDSMSGDNVINVMTRLLTGRPTNRGSIFKRIKRDTFCAKRSHRFSGPHSLLFSGCCGESGGALKIASRPLVQMFTYENC